MFGNGSKPMASLSSGLLARKGQARPAMRSQGFSGFGGVAQGLDDLGWNDMGDAAAAAMPVAPEPVPAPTPAAAPVAAALPAVDAPSSASETIPPVLVERERLEAAVAPPPVVKSVSVATATRLRRETQHAGKAAFTLRVDANRHLRLRIASAITNRSSQDLVTEALDALIGAIPEVDALVAQLPPARKTR
ncbi:hypothetical protein D9601_03550 [Sphingomonas sp. MA1305]|uniref:hypothetical protein n=1 Tax=Sphingomonas sp. MA1305 TaxID=2479204 RepID=UPI0018DFD37F|nr:hypothetical protein [Sphingomonas sp. MA1305]MBI0474439.1 hypothetical protein [Sphingomonas sp. MA1305]